MKVGIFGGSFNPPHKMHKRIGLELIKKGYVDKIIYVPVQDNYNKKDLLPFKDRYNMVKQMIKGNNDLLVSSLARFGYIYTYMVLDYFSKKYDKVYFICGCDNLKDFKNKYHTHSLSFTSPTELKELMNLIPGEVGPFGLLNDKEAKIKFYIDEAFMTDSHLIGVHPNDNTVSLWLKVEDLIKIIENNGNNIYFFNL